MTWLAAIVAIALLLLAALSLYGVWRLIARLLDDAMKQLTGGGMLTDERRPLQHVEPSEPWPRR